MTPRRRRARDLFASCLLVVSLIGTAARASELELTPPTGVAVVLVTPRGKLPGVRASDLSEAVRAALSARARVLVEPTEYWGLEPQSFGDCPAETRFSCWVRASRGGAANLRFVLVASAFVVAADQLRLATYWIDLERARGVVVAGRSDAEVDKAIFDLVVAPPAAVIAAQPEVLAAHFQAWSAQLVTTLPASALRDNFGAIRLVLDAPSSVDLDGKSLGELASGTHLITGAEPGAYRVRARPAGPSEVVREASVIVEAGAESSVSLAVAPTPEGVPAWFVASAAGVAVAGGVLVFFGASEYRATCARGDPECDASPALATACELDPSACPMISGAVLLAAGSGLLTLAVTAGAGALLVEDEGPPWWSILAGAALGGVALGISAAAL